jgi:hypothetical protein
MAYIESNLFTADSSALLISILIRTEDPNYSTRQTQAVASWGSEQFGGVGSKPPDYLSDERRFLVETPLVPKNPVDYLA